MGFIFTITESDKSFALSATNEKIPAWNYFIIRLQLFILYFYAGLKKTEEDWLLGYSMGKLSKQWVFDPIRFIGFSDDFINKYVIHLGGFMIDLTTGPMLLFDLTRPIAILQVNFKFNVLLYKKNCPIVPDCDANSELIISEAL